MHYKCGIHPAHIYFCKGKISLISDDFIDITYEPAKFVSISGISQVAKSVPVFELPVALPTLNGVCQLAVDSRLPPRTVLLGLDFGRDNIIALINHLKSDPTPILSVTRAMQAESDLATHVAETLQSTEGAQLIALDDIVEVDAETIEPVPAVVESSTSDKAHDTLVPLSIPTLNFDGITKDKFVELQHNDISLAPLWEHAKKGEKHFFIVNQLLMCMTSTLTTVSHAIVVPRSLRHKVLLAAHEGLGHGGVTTTRSLINKHFTWPNLSSDIKTHISPCKKCLLYTKSNGPKLPMIEAEIISQRGEKLAVDIVSPLPLSKDKKRYILTSMELSSGFPFAIPLKTYTSEETANVILSIISLLGAPLQILSDQGSNFLSTTLSHLKHKFHISTIKTSPYHPQSNGRLERFHATLKTMLSKAISEKQEWTVVLDLVLYFARNTPNTKHGFTPHELLFLKPTMFILSTLKSIWTTPSSSNVNLPQFIHDMDNMIACQTHHVMKALASKHSSNRLSHESELAADFSVGDIVYKRNPGFNKCLDSSWNGPFTISQLLPPVNCSIVPQGRNANPKWFTFPKSRRPCLFTEH